MPISTCWNHQHPCSHAMVFPTNCKSQLPDILSDSLRAGRSGDRIPVWTRFSAPLQTGPGAHPVSYAMGTGSVSRGQSDRSVALTIPYLAPRLKKECSYTSTPPLGLRGLLQSDQYLVIVTSYIHSYLTDGHYKVNVLWQVRRFM